MIDFHAHLLPGIDDGSDSVATSVAMLEQWQRQGIRRICATPHFYADRTTPTRFLRNRQAAFEQLSAAMGETGRDTDLRLGAEVLYFSGIGSTDVLGSLCLTGTSLLLLEMPFIPWSERMLDEVAELSDRGVTPVAAHVERYFPIQSKKVMRRFLESDILIQVNASFFLERSTQKQALKMLKEGSIHFLGSDAHNVTTRRPNLGEAVSLIRERLGERALEDLAHWERVYLPESGAAN